MEPRLRNLKRDLRSKKRPDLKAIIGDGDLLMPLLSSAAISSFGHKDRFTSWERE
jgi:hypothetical protein